MFVQFKQQSEIMKKFRHVLCQDNTELWIHFTVKVKFMNQIFPLKRLNALKSSLFRGDGNFFRRLFEILISKFFYSFCQHVSNIHKIFNQAYKLEFKYQLISQIN